MQVEVHGSFWDGWKKESKHELCSFQGSWTTMPQGTGTGEEVSLLFRSKNRVRMRTSMHDFNRPYRGNPGEEHSFLLSELSARTHSDTGPEKRLHFRAWIALMWYTERKENVDKFKGSRRDRGREEAWKKFNWWSVKERSNRLRDHHKVKSTRRLYSG